MPVFGIPWQWQRSVQWSATSSFRKRTMLTLNQMRLWQTLGQKLKL